MKVFAALFVAILVSSALAIVEDPAETPRRAKRGNINFSGTDISLAAQDAVTITGTNKVAIGAATHEVLIDPNTSFTVPTLTSSESTYSGLKCHYQGEMLHFVPTDGNAPQICFCSPAPGQVTNTAPNLIFYCTTLS